MFYQSAVTSVKQRKIPISMISGMFSWVRQIRQEAYSRLKQLQQFRSTNESRAIVRLRTQVTVAKSHWMHVFH